MSSSSKKGGGADAAADARKFLFDENDFDQLKSRAKSQIYTEEQLLLAKDQSFAQGKSEGAKETRQQQEERIGELLGKAVTTIDRLAQDEDRREVEKCIAATKLAMQALHKLLPKFSQQCALSEIENAVVQAIETRRDEPRIAVTVPTVHLDALKERIDALSVEKGYAGRVILIADDGLAATDCRVEWADGGADRLFERLFSQIDSEFTKALSGMNMVLGQEDDSTTPTGTENKK